MNQPKTYDEFMALPVSGPDYFEEKIGGITRRIPLMRKARAVAYEPDTAVYAVDKDGRSWRLVPDGDGFARKLAR